MNSPPGAAVTGLGTLGAWGAGRDSLAAALALGETLPASEIDRAAGYHRARGARRALFAGSCTGEWLSPAEGRRMSPPSRLTVVASRMAMAEAAWPDLRAAEEGTAVVLGTAFGPSSFSEALIRQILDAGPEAASPFLFTESVANAPAAQVAITAGCHGSNVTVCQREASALLAVVRGAGLVAGGKAPAVLAGSVDEMSPLLHALLDRFGALCRGGGPDGEVARPFDRRRDGMLASEGATVLAIEREDHAAARGVRPLARILGGGGAFDPTAPPTGFGHDAPGLARSLGRLLERLGVPLGRIDLVVSGASGSRGGDRLEAKVLKTLWKDFPLPPVFAPKGVTGEYGGGFLAAAVLAAAGATFGPTGGFGEADPGLGVVPHDGRPLPAPRIVLATSLAAGGAAAWLVLEAP